MCMSYVNEKHFHWKLIIPFALDKQVAFKMELQVQCALCIPARATLWRKWANSHIVFEACQLSSMIVANRSFWNRHSISRNFFFFVRLSIEDENNFPFVLLTAALRDVICRRINQSNWRAWNYLSGSSKFDCLKNSSRTTACLASFSFQTS